MLGGPVAAHLDPWILAAEPDHDARTTSIPLLGTPEWVAADEVTRNAAVALYVIACLAEREPVVIAGPGGTPCLTVKCWVWSPGVSPAGPAR